MVTFQTEVTAGLRVTKLCPSLPTSDLAPVLGQCPEKRKDEEVSFSDPGDAFSVVSALAGPILCQGCFWKDLEPWPVADKYLAAPCP